MTYLNIDDEFKSELHIERKKLKRTRANKFSFEFGCELLKSISDHILILEKELQRKTEKGKVSNSSQKFTPTKEKNTNLNEAFLPLTEKQTLAIVAVHFQQGGTAKGCDGNTTVELFNKTIKLAHIRKALREKNQRGVERKLARTFATEIYQICLELQIQGNLANKIKRNHPESTFTEPEAVWLSDFQSDNEDCPPVLRSMIIECFKPSTKKKK